MKTDCWIITEGMAGTENQCLGVAEALGLTPGLDARLHRINLRQPWKALCPYLPFEQGWSFVPRLAPPWPDLLLTAGRKSIAAARYIHRQSGGRTFTVHLQNPRISGDFFDLIAMPAHDRTAAHGRAHSQIIYTDGAPNRITPERLARARAAYTPSPSMPWPMPAPVTAVLIGGDSKTHALPPERAAEIARQISALPGTLLVTASRRTSPAALAAFRENLRRENACLWDGAGENPYLAFLALADFILVTADSVSMLSDACTTGKPVYMLPLPGDSHRFSDFHARLRDKGALKVFDGGAALTPFTYAPLDDSRRVAQAIQSAMKSA